VRASEQDRPDVKAKREEWKVGQPSLDPDKLVFVDETWASTNMHRTHGRCAKGERLVMDVPHGHWKTTTFVAALRVDGMTAPTVIDGPMTGDLFVAYVEQQLVPTLRPGDVVVMDNLACHKRAGVERAIQAAGCELRLLPAYSPDLNPIEKAFSKLKAGLRKAAKRTVPEVEELLGQLSDSFAPAECRNYFRCCGYPDATRT
jgi:transposase